MKNINEQEWVEVNGDILTFGLRKEALEEMGDINFISLPKVGDRVKKGDLVSLFESSKTAFEIYAPLSGEIVKVNQDAQSLSDAKENLWLFEMRIDPLKYETLKAIE